MSTDLIVISTLGGNDLQFLVTHEGKRKKIAPRNTGEVHRALRDAGDSLYEWWLPDNPDAELPEVKSAAYSFDPKNGFRPDRSEVALVDAPKLLLVPGILWRDLLKLREELRRGEVRVRRLILVHTDRDAKNPRAANEPSAAAPLLARWLPGWLGTDPDPEFVDVVAALRGMEELQVRNEEGGVFLLPEAAERIDASFRMAAARFPGCPARMHDAGGMPAIVEAVRSAARLHFRVEYRTPPEGESARLPVVAGLRHTAVETFDARRRACELVREGQFLTAAGLAADFRRPGPEAEWTRVLEVVGKYIQGYVTQALDRAGKLPGCHSRQALLAIAARGQLRSLHVALRGEAAVRADDTQSAAALTGTFLDAALFDAIDLTLRKDPTQSCVNWVWREIRKDQFSPTEGTLQTLGTKVQNQNLPWVKLDADEIRRWSKRRTLRAMNSAHEHILIEAVREKNGVLGQMMLSLSKQWNDPTPGTPTPNEYRNMFIHGLPPESEIKKAAKVFIDRGLWRPTTFLRGTHPGTVLDALGVHDPAAFYDELVDAVVKDILRHPIN